MKYRSKYKKALVYCMVFLGLIGSLAIASAKDYYVSTTGSDNNPGSYSAPFKTFSKAASVLNPGDSLKIFPGTYYDRLELYKSGTSSSRITVMPVSGSVVIDRKNWFDTPLYVRGSYITVQNIEIRNSVGICALISGSNLVLSQLAVHDCNDHGVYLDGKQITLKDSKIYNTNMKNKNKDTSWGSAVKVDYPAADILLENNQVYRNYGEGFGITRGVRVTLRKNYVKDNYSVNIYIDNSKTVTADSNFVTCTQYSGFERDGQPPTGIALAEEYYSGWGGQLSNINIKNNIVSFCRRGVAYYGASSQITNGGLLNVSILYNTFYGLTDTGIVLEYEPYKTKNVKLYNNIIYQSSQRFAWIASSDKKWASFYNNFWVGGTPPSWMGVSGSGDKTGDVRFVSVPSIDASSYKLSYSSPARKSAKYLSYVNTDYSGKSRYSDSYGDMGALEY